MINEKGQFLKGHKNSKKTELRRRKALKLVYTTGKRKPLKYWLGKKLSEEHRKKVSIGNIGKKRTRKYKKIISDRMKLAWKNPEYRENIVKKCIGRKQSIETIQKRIPKISGKNNWHWKGGITPLIRKIRNCWKMQQWKRDCKKLSDKCVLCNSKKRLIVDHIKTFSLILKQNKIDDYDKSQNCSELWDVNNGRVICNDCHLKTDTYGNRDIQI